MQKVITISTNTNIMEREQKFHESEYPVLDQYLKDNYRVVQVIPVTPNANAAYYSLTFVLEKK